MRTFSNSLFVLLFLVGSGYSSLFSAPENLPLGEIKVVRVTTDTARYYRGGEIYPLERGAILTESDRLVTGNAKVMLAFSNGSLCTVMPDTDLNFSVLRQAPIPSTVQGSFNELEQNPSESHTLINLSRGEILSHVKELKAAAPSSKFEVATKVGIAGIRGTQFKVVYVEDEQGQVSVFRVDVLAGTIEIFTPDRPDQPFTEVTGGKYIEIKNLIDDAEKEDSRTIERGEISSTESEEIQKEINALENDDSADAGDNSSSPVSSISRVIKIDELLEDVTPKSPDVEKPKEEPKDPDIDDPDIGNPSPTGEN